MCFGVRDAVALAFEHGAARPLTILGDLVHNETVSASLKAAGIAVVRDIDRVQTQTVMVTAHGASARRIEAARARGLTVLEATCPLVHVAHRAVTSLVRNGFHPVIIGRRGHVEVRGLTEDFDAFDIVGSEDDVRRLAPHPRIGVAAQTTESIERVRHLGACIRRRFPESEVRFIDTVCQPTKQRQQAAVDLARRSDVVIVVGGADSNNTRELVATCGRYCGQVHHVQTDADLCAAWFQGAASVGITAGTSTPDSIVERVERRIRALAARAEEPAPHAGAAR
jgi:4-hydroxy-3-methylbut-2-enyl diphosphate reductase